MINDVCQTLLPLSISGSIIALILFSIKPLIRNRINKTWQFYIWLVVVARLLIPYVSPINVVEEVTMFAKQYKSAVEIPTTTEIPPIIAHSLESQKDTTMNDILQDEPFMITNNEAVSQQMSHESPELTFREKLFDFSQQSLPFISLTWLIICNVLFFRKIASYYSFIRLVKKSSKAITKDAVLEQYQSTCQVMGIKKMIPLYSSNIVISPMCLGFFKHCIVLPDKYLDNLSHLHYIFRHELTHYRRLDIYYKWLVQIALCIHWFNPIAYFVSKEVNKYCELSCDEIVIKKLNATEQKAYGDTLLHSLEFGGYYSNAVVSLTLTENTKLMKERLSAIMKFQKKSKLSICISALLTLIFCATFIFTGVQANSEILEDNTTENKRADTSDYLSITLDDIQNIEPMFITGIGARAYSNKWASATGIEANTYQEQLNQKIKWIEDLYSEKNERFMLNEAIQENEITNTLGIRYMYEKSPVYRDMANIDGDFKLLPYDSYFSRSGNKKYYERSVFYVGRPAVITFSISYELSEGKIALLLVSPEGKISYIAPDASQYDNSVTLPLSAGLWSIITVNESETGILKGTQKIEGKISYTENIIVPINIQELKPNERKIYGPYYLNDTEAWSVDIDSWNGEGEVFIADIKEGDAFEHGIIIDKAPNGAAFLVNEAKYYYITIGNSGNTTLKKIAGNLVLNFTGIYQSPKTDDAMENNGISIDIPKITENIYVKDYGKYELNEGDKVIVDLDWSGEGHVMFLYTKQKFDKKDIAELVEKGILPLGSVAKVFSTGHDNIPSLSTNFTYKQANKELKLNFATTPNNPLYWENQVPEAGIYYIYIIGIGDTSITDITGGITLPASTNPIMSNLSVKNDLSTLGFPSRLTKDQLPDNLKSWIDECDKNQDLYLISKNDTWYVYCNLVKDNYSLDIDNVTEQGSVVLNISDIEGGGTGDGYVLLSVPNYDNIRVTYKDKKVEFTNGDLVSNPISEKKELGLGMVDSFDNDEIILEYYFRNVLTTDSYHQHKNDNKIELTFSNFSGSQIIYEFDYPSPVTVDFSISADVGGEYKIAIISENNKVIAKASSYNGLSASKPIEFPKGKTKIVLTGEKASGYCNISFSS